MMMFYRRRALPKHCYNMAEVEYGGGGHRTQLRNDPLINLCVLGCPAPPVYKGARGEVGRPLWARQGGGVLLLVGVGPPPFPTPTRREKEGEEGGRKEGGAASPS